MTGQTSSKNSMGYRENSPKTSANINAFHQINAQNKQLFTQIRPILMIMRKGKITM